MRKNVSVAVKSLLRQQVWLTHCKLRHPQEMPFHRQAMLEKENPANTEDEISNISIHFFSCLKNRYHKEQGK